MTFYKLLLFEKVRASSCYNPNRIVDSELVIKWMHMIQVVQEKKDVRNARNCRSY